MEILLLLIVVVIVFAVLKTRVFSSEEEKCFRRIWAMKKSGLFDEEHATYDRLFKKFDIDFNSSVSNQNLNTLINAAHLFDGTKNQRNLGVWVGRVVEEKIKMKMYEHGKAAQYDDLIAKNMAKGAELIDNNLTEFNQESCVEHLREISKDNTELDFEEDIESKCIVLGFQLAMIDGKLDDKEADAIRGSMDRMLNKRVNYTAFVDGDYLVKVSKQSYIQVAGEIRLTLLKLVSDSDFPKSGSIAANTFEQSLVASLVTIAAIDGVAHENEKEFIANVIDLYEMGSEYKSYILDAMKNAATRFS